MDVTGFANRSRMGIPLVTIIVTVVITFLELVINVFLCIGSEGGQEEPTGE